MEANLRSYEQRPWKMLIFLCFALFLMATTTHAQLLGLGAPDITVQPVGTNVQNGDTVTFTTAANCGSLADIPTVTWLYNGSSTLPTNAVVTTTGLNTQNITSTLTLKNVSSASAGKYSVDIEDELLGINILGADTAWADSQNADLSVTPVVTGVATGSEMVTKGFKFQFSGPTGSNLVIQASTDMKHWTSISTNVITDGSVTYTDAAAMTMPGRYYRAKLE